jgi:proteasome lid subunit RPN8/RPN11
VTELHSEKISLDGETLETIIAWQRSAGAREICAFCVLDSFGKQHLLQLTNHAGLPDAFEISSAEETVAKSVASQRDWTIIAFVHTHPSDPPDLSPRDERWFVRDTLPWIIVGAPTTNPSQRTFVQTIGGK